MNWFDKMKKGIRTRLVRNLEQDLWMQCPSCQQPLYRPQVERNLEVCPECDCHFPMGGRRRLDLVIDAGTFEEMDEGMTSLDPLRFPEYREKLARDQKGTGMRSALVGGTGRMEGSGVVIGVTDRRFLMGSMGSVVGEKVKRLIARSLETRCPLILVSGSGGGARMHEGILSLMQMAKVSAALARYDEAGGLFISVLTNPT
ncbi:acetyl-CoA carboxylase carboxyl transferase subunit beta, partial [bacterium]|nr:acetyl-CoA carboxylase carboxyl transferase subunit beta [bacterium]